ncbi:MAG TPA: CHASE2 domain-containing protein, partial [Terriglobales bacterium]
MKRLSIKRADLFISFLVTAVALILFSYSDLNKSHGAALGFLHNIELRSLDARFVLRGPRPHDDNIVIVGLDENTLQKVGAFPIPRDAYAKMVDQLARDGAKVIAFDFNFPVPEKNSAVETLRELEKQAPAGMTDKLRELERLRDNDAIFAESIRRAGNVVLGHLFLDAERAKSVAAEDVEAYHYILTGHVFPQIQKVSGSEAFDVDRSWAEAKGNVANGVYPNIKLLADAAKSFGFFDEDPDPDGTFRHATLLIHYAGDYFPSLALETVRQAEHIKNQDSIAYFGSRGLERVEIGSYKFFTEGDGRALINFTGPYKTYKQYAMIDVINGSVPPGTFRDKIVLFGATAVAIGDVRNMPYGSPSYMGVEVHANIVDNILHSGEPGRGFLRRGITEESIDVAFILLFGIGLGYWFGGSRPLISTASLVVALSVFSAIVYFAFTHYGMWLGFVIPAGTLVANYACITSFRMIFEEREKRRVRRNFERYVSPGVISLIEQDPTKYFQTGGESKEMTILFSDIRRFTEISESLTPNELVSLLNEYLGEMTEVLFHHWGTLDKYIGDAIMGFWNSPYPQPDHATRACSTALDMQARLKELNQKWVADGGRAIHSGVGINTGVVNVGNMGSDKRFSWTVIGDNVNLASRLESATKEYHVNVIVAEGTFDQAKESFVFRELDYIRVMGKQQPVRIFELVDFALKRADHEQRIQLWMQGLELYRRGAWEEAIPAFEDVLKRYPDDGPSILFIERCEEKAREAPAEVW